MLDFLRGGNSAIRERASERKLRLFAVGCCCRIMRLLTDQRSVNAVLAMDRLIDGKASSDELRDAIAEARRAYENAFQTHDYAALGVTFLVRDGYQAATSAAASAVHGVGHHCAAGEVVQAEIHRKTTEGENAEQKQQAELLRHIIGNPFHPYPAPDHWPTTVIGLAQAVYEGENSGPVLHDALLEAGHPELAEHFQRETWHPKGCWVVDLVLAKE
jgi:hypothetical protein